MGLIKRGNQKKFGGLMVKIREQYSFDIDVYSKTLSSAYKLMENPSESKIKIDNYRGRDSGRGRGRRGRRCERRERRDTVTGIQYA